MKSKLIILGIILAIICLTSCSERVCPTYASTVGYKNIDIHYLDKSYKPEKWKN